MALSPYLLMTPHGPAARIHPEQPIPTTIIDVEPWSDGDQRGVFVTRGYPRPEHPRGCLVFDPEQPLRAPSAMGGAIGSAVHELAYWDRGRLTDFTVALGILPPGLGPDPDLEPLPVHPDQDLPSTFAIFTVNGQECLGTAHYPTLHPIIRDPGAPLRRGSGLSAVWRNSIHRQRTSPPAEPVVQPSATARVDLPPAPGLRRARWIGDRIAAMTSRESSAYLPHTRRRIAAHRALSIVAGYTPQDAENDGLVLPGGLLLHLEGLNQYAARAFASGQED